MSDAAASNICIFTCLSELWHKLILKILHFHNAVYVMFVMVVLYVINAT